jgi:hypothetical protein
MDARLPVRRRFSTLDGMILVGALASGFGVLRMSSPEANWGDILERAVSLSDWSVGSAGLLMVNLLTFATPMAVSLTMALLVLRNRQPRPPWRRLMRRPGTMACLAPSCGWAFGVMFAAAAMADGGADELRWPGSPGLWIEVFSLAASFLAGFAVAITWIILVAIRRWHPEPSWLDRLGRLAGAGWIALSLLTAYALFWQTI